MKAMIFAAGKGTRLHPITHNLPKALVPFNGTPLLELLILKCLKYSITDIVINIHHHGEQIVEFLEKKRYFGINIQISDERSLLLDTGGGLKKATPFLHGNDPILIHNVDIVSDLDFNELLNKHQAAKALATLAVMERSSNRRFLVNSQHLVCGWENVATGEQKIVKNFGELLIPASYCGIAIIESHFLDLIKQEGIFSLTDTILDLAANYPIQTVFFPKIKWADVGTPEKLKEAEELFKQIF
ncbi:MAG: sugar phosphate nucleotidyltransferase [Bacteroidales bacterium]|nr:sugar phosphate nucleotidyltransferase [Bacteroidales bacterium]